MFLGCSQKKLHELPVPREHPARPAPSSPGEKFVAVIS